MQYFQILPRLIPVDGAPTWVLDVPVPALQTLPTAHIYQYFTGNAVGGTVLLDFGGVHCMLVAGLNIREAPTPLPPIPPTNWASLHDAPPIPLQYLTHLLTLSGIPESEVKSIFYSKADQSLGKQTRTFVGQKKILERRALMSERPTIIFQTSVALQQFIQQFPLSHSWRHLSDACIGFATDAVLPPSSPALTPPDGTPLTPQAFKLTCNRESINILNPPPLQKSTHVDNAPLHLPSICFPMAARLLMTACSQMETTDFQQELARLYSNFRPPQSTTESLNMDVDAHLDLLGITDTNKRPREGNHSSDTSSSRPDIQSTPKASNA